MVSIEKTRARSFKAALESLQECTKALIESLDLQLDDSVSETDYESKREALGDDETLINVFDDAVEMTAIERNAYVDHCELDCLDLTVRFKEVE